MSLVKIREYLDRPSADLWRSILEASDIKTVVNSDDMGGTRPDMWVVGRIHLLVEESQLEEAEALLTSLERNSQNVDTNDTADSSATTKTGTFSEEQDSIILAYQRSLGQLLVVAVVGLFMLPGISHVYCLIRFLDLKRERRMAFSGHMAEPDSERGELSSHDLKSWSLIVICVLGLVMAAAISFQFFE